MSASLLKVPQVAEMIGCSPAQVRKLSARGQFIPAQKIPGLGVRYHRELVQEWIDQAGGRA